jgi:2-methylisocitrate lyase-like PEP mutase family enzyme
VFHLEDQATTKRCGHLSNEELVPASTFNSRIRAAAVTRVQLARDIVIIARTDALANLGYDEAVSRLKGAIECGGRCRIP